MKKNFLLIVCQMLLLCGMGMKGYAQLEPCTTFNGGPYNQGVTSAGCDGNDLQLFGLAVWQEEVYFADVIAGGNYTFYLNGCSEDAWGDPVMITALLGGTLNADPDGYQGPGTGSISDGTVQGVAQGCEITFTATASGTCYFILSTTSTCGGPNVQVDNGLPQIITNEGVPCDDCGNGNCAVGEDYCNCTDDCPCGDLVTPVYIFRNAANDGWTGDDVATPTAIFCAYNMIDLVGADGEEGYVYMGLGFFGANCLASSTLDASADFGQVVDFGLVEATTITEASVQFLKLSQADIDASGGTITVTLTDPNAPANNPCEVPFVINVADLGTPASLVNDLCPPLNFECGNNDCEQGENYCTCADCDCSTVVTPVFISFDEANQQFVGGPTFSANAAFCEANLTGNANPEPNVIYIGIGFFGNGCMTDGTMDITPTQGVVVQFDDTGVASEVTNIADAGVSFLRVTQAEIDASGGTTTIAYSNPSDGGSGGACSLSVSINWASLGAVATLVDDLCGPIEPQDQCTQFAAGPYGDQGIDVAPECGESVSAPYAAWLNEIYFTTIVADRTYTFSICDGYSETAWGAPALITVIYNDGSATVDTDNGEVIGGQILDAVEGCEVTFESPGEGDVYFILSTAINCGGATQQVDNGIPTVSTSCGESVENNTTQYGLSVSPVPATNAVQIAYNAQKASNVTINVYDISGKLLNSQTEQANSGANKYSLNIANYAAGVYFATLNDGQQTATVKFVKQ